MYSIPMNLPGLIYLKLYDRAAERCATHPDEARMYIKDLDLIPEGYFDMTVMFLICGFHTPIPLNLLHVLLQFNPDATCWHNRRGYELVGTPLTILVKRIFNFQFADDRHDDPESIALIENLIEALKMILETKPEAAMTITSGSTLLHQALQYEGLVRSTPLPLFSTALRLLLDNYPLATKVRDRSGRLPLHMACLYARNDQFNGPILGLYRLLLMSYPDAIFSQDKYGKTPLHYHLEFQLQLESEHFTDNKLCTKECCHSHINMVSSRIATVVLWKAACLNPLVFITQDSDGVTPLSSLDNLIYIAQIDGEGLDIFSALRATSYYTLLREHPESSSLLIR